MIKAVDLFCGAGGLTRGLENVGINVVAGYDIEAECRYAYETNNKSVFLEKNVIDISSSEILAHFEGASVTILAGCAPCQPFSKYSGGKDVKKDKKWPLLNEFSRLIKEVQPDIVTMENVPGGVRHSIYDDFVRGLEKLGYFVWAKKVYCPDYGMPQVRKRHVLLASKKRDLQLIAPTHNPNTYITVRDTIGHLPEISAGETSKADPLHRAAKLSSLNLKRIRSSKAGGTWRDWPIELIADCHKKDTGKNYTGVYARMEWDSPSPTMTTQCFGYGNGRFGHPVQDRAISLREAAAFQTFPDTYEFSPENEATKLLVVGKLIGNAVPVRLGEVIGESIIRHIEAPI